MSSSVRGSSYSVEEDVFLSRVYLNLSQDPILGRNQKFWKSVASTYNAEKQSSWDARTVRSVEGRMGTILHAVRKLKNCVIQVENMRPSGASEQDIMHQAKILILDEPKLGKGFKFDHVWHLLKDIQKFTHDCDVNIQSSPSPQVHDEQNSSANSPISASPGLSGFSINLSEDDTTNNSSERPMGVKKAKLKRKMNEDRSSAVDKLTESAEKLLSYLKEKSSTRDKNQEMVQQLLNNESKKLALKELKQENKILFTDLNSIRDENTRAYIQSQQASIIAKRSGQQQSQSSSPNFYGQFFNNLGGDGSDLPDY